MEVTRLPDMKTVHSTCTQHFSNSRIIVADFKAARDLLQSLVKQLYTGRGIFRPRLKMIIQCTEKYEEGLSEVERTLLQNICALSGSKKTLIVEHDEVLDFRALQHLFQTF